MKIDLIAKPQPTTGSMVEPLASGSQLSPRERAIQAFQKSAAPQETPVANPNQVSPEELSAVMPATDGKKEEEKEEVSTQSAEQEDKGATPEATEEKKDEPSLSSQFAILARKEKALRAKVQAQESALKAREAALAEKEAAIKAKESSYSTDYISKNKLTEDPLSTLLEVGVDYDTITQRVLAGQPNIDPQTKMLLNEMRNEIKALRDEQGKTKQTFEEQQQQSYKQAVNQIRNEVKSLVKVDPQFEMIAATNSVQDVVDLIEQTFQADGYLMTVEEAAAEVENYLVEEAAKIAKLSKIQKRLAPPPAKATEAAPKPTENKPSQPQTKTLTNAVSTPGQLSRRDRAIAAFKGEFKKTS